MAADSAEGTFRFFLDQYRSAYWMRGPIGAAWWGALVGLPADEAAEAWALCARMHLLADEESPDDVLPLIALDRRLPRYPLESADAHRARLLDAWSIYELGGTEYVIQSQLRAAGYGPTSLIDTWGQAGHTWGEAGYYWENFGAFVQFRPDATGPRGEAPPYRTQFWLIFPRAFHDLENDMIAWGDFEWGDSTDGVWSWVGYTDDFIRTVLGIVMKWKPSTEVFRGFTFRLGTITSWAEAGHTWGEADEVWGGALETEVQLGTVIP